MASKPKRWMIQTLSPKLEPKDLRTMLDSSGKQNNSDGVWTHNSREGLNGSFTLVSRQHSVTLTSQETENMHDVSLGAKRVEVSEGGYSRHQDPSSPASVSSDGSSSSSHGFYSFVEEESDTEAEKMETWMVSPERQSKLATLKEENGFKLQAYSEKKPKKLFQDSNSDPCYQLANVPATALNDLDPVQERLEIIRSQAPKKKLISTEHWEALESLDLSNPPQRVLAGLTQSYSPFSTDREQIEVNTIDTEKISFSAARQQFLKMEQSKSTPIKKVPLPQPSKNQGRPPLAVGGVMMQKRDNYYSPSREEPTTSPTQELNLVRSDLFDSKGGTVNTSEEKTAIQSTTKLSHRGTLHPVHASDQYASSTDLGQESDEEPLPLDAIETPIEREIRIAQEREESLRRERGIKLTNAMGMVKIKTTSFLSPTGPSAIPTKAKEKSRVSFYIQREMAQEKQREENLHHQGRVSGLYNRGTPQDLGERKRVFEQQANLTPVTPTKTSIAGSLLDDLQSKAGADEGVRTSEDIAPAKWESNNKTEDNLPPCSPHWHPQERAQWMPNPRRSSIKERYARNPQSLIDLIHEESVNATNGNKIKDTSSQSATTVMSANSMNLGNDPSTSMASSKVITPAIYTLSPSTSSSNPSTPTDLQEIRSSLSGKSIMPQTGTPEQFSLTPCSTLEAIRKEIEQDIKREEEIRLLRAGCGLSLSLEGDFDGMDKMAPSTDTTDLGTVMLPSKNDIPNLLKLKKEALVSSAPSDAQPEKSEASLPSPRGFNATQSVPVTSKDKLWVTGTSPQSPSFPSVSIVTAQPWSSPWAHSPSTIRAQMRLGADVPSTRRGLTETMLQDRTLRAKLEESVYGGIQPTDDINNEVLEAIRVTRHKNVRALRWEAGVFANKDGD